MPEHRHGVAFIGAGAVVKHRHLPGLALSGRGAPRAIFDPAEERAQDLAARFQIPVVADSLEAAVTADGVDSVVIASPNARHREAVECAAAHGKHIFCEKPIAVNLKDARAMCRAAADAGVILFLGFHHRFSAEHKLVRRIMEAGHLGEVRAFDSLIGEPMDVVPQGTANYRFDPSAGGGLTLIDVGSHRIDQTIDLLGEVDEVHAGMASVLSSHNMDDSVVLSLRMKSGAIGTLQWHRFVRAFQSPCTLLGTKGTACFSAFAVNPYQSAPVALYLESDPAELPADLAALYRPERWWGEGRPGWIEFWPARENTFQRQYEAFFDAIEHNPPPPVGGEAGYRALEVVMAAYLSLRERRPVMLPIDPELEIAPPSF